MEYVYSRQLFPYIRRMLDGLLGWSPVPLLYIFIPLVLFFTVRSIWKDWQIRKKLLARGYTLFLTLISLVGGLVFFFQVLWGLNYQRLPLQQQLELPKTEVDSVGLEFLWAYSTHMVDSLRRQLAGEDTTAIAFGPEADELEREVRASVNTFMQGIGLQTYSRTRARLLKPTGILLRFSTSGFYFPFTGECNLDSGLHPLQKPFVMAHEFGHAYGFGDEGECNFLAFLCTIQSEDPYLQYSGWLALWRYVVRDFRAAFPGRFAEEVDALPRGPLNDWEAIRLQMIRFPDIMPRFRDMAYQAYLKSQGVHEGLRSYNQIVRLAHVWFMQANNK